MNTTEYQVPQGETTGLKESDIAYLDKLIFDHEGNLVAWPAQCYGMIPLEHLRTWCCLRGRYGIPTVDLLWWLRQMIAGRSALEIGAGCGDLGFLLGIPMTDSYQQVEEETTVAYFKQYGIEPARPRPEVIKEDAENAVRKRRPQVVIGSWITEKWLGVGSGNVFGPREDYILERCQTYILIGNEAVHGRKRLLQLPHETYKFPWLVSRAKDQSKNVIYVWHNPTWR